MAFQTGDWVVRLESEREHDYWKEAQGKPHRVVSVYSNSGDIILGGVNPPRHWYYALFRLATLDEVANRPFELGDWIVRKGAGGFYADWSSEDLAKAWRVNSLPAGRRVGSIGIAGKPYYGTRVPDGWDKKLFRHATPEEYREAIRAAKNLDVAYSLEKARHADVVLSVVKSRQSEVGEKIAVSYADLEGLKEKQAMEDEPLENSNVDEPGVDVEALEAKLAEYEERIAALEFVPLVPLIPPPRPFLYDRITGEGPYIDITHEDDELSKDGHRYYYAGELTLKKKRKIWEQDCLWLWPETLTTEKPEPPEEMVSKEKAHEVALTVSKVAKADGYNEGYALGKKAGGAKEAWAISTGLLIVVGLLIFLISLMAEQMPTEQGPPVKTEVSKFGDKDSCIPGSM